MSSMWKQVVDVQQNEVVERFMNSAHFVWIVGNGGRVMFWHDRWCVAEPLKLVFPRLYGLVVDKIERVGEVLGRTEAYWRGCFRRELRAFEGGMLRDLLACIQGFVLRHDIVDRLIWTPETTGEFSVKALNKLMSSLGVSDMSKVNWPWRLPLLPKLQCFIWSILLDRLPTLSMLIARGLPLGETSVVCRFCGAGEDAIDHILWDCSTAWKIWDYYFTWWGVTVTRPRQVREFIVMCFNSFFYGDLREWWLIGCTSVLWSIWLARNALMFQDKILPIGGIFFLIQLRSFHWTRIRFDKVDIREAAWWECPLLCVNDAAGGQSIRGAVAWVLPWKGMWKFNVDGAARGKPGLAGCGGVLRDWESRIRGLFSGAIRMADSNEAEVQAISFALKLLRESSWEGVQSIVIESDSRVALAWIQGVERRPWRLWRWFFQIDDACESLPNVCFAHVFREELSQEIFISIHLDHFLIMYWSTGMQAKKIPTSLTFNFSSKIYMTRLEDVCFA
ncbi:hypothetical protein HRI_003838600 [Hibiscus trionum]|uniref:Reverse transcriptase zinc-binding domain-containing protein n=1 Tax=Hibiscus trionum TaxID=183268 RepID=A0A9W7IXG1_HIBTR|nr:hypothetical protein HRI_003838600 [Hibiscus trionum]